MDGDRKPDILCCAEWSVYPFFSHVAIEMKQRPAYQLGEVRTVACRAFPDEACELKP